VGQYNLEMCHGGSLSYLNILEEYRSDRHHLIQDFYLPCLENSVLYCRAVGYFSSSSIVTVASGLTGLIRMGGKMRLVASPCLTPEDVEAIMTGLQEKEKVITQAIFRELEQEFNTVARDRLACLAWLLSQGFLEIKLAIPSDIRKNGIYHEKLGLFSDKDGNTVAFTGSANESYAAWQKNFECIDVFCSWKREEKERTLRKIQHFQKLWDNNTQNIQIIDFPEAAAKSLLKFRPDQPTFRVKEDKSSYRFSAKPVLNITLRPLQEDALKAWEEQNYRGILAMATGTGKTLTAIVGMMRLSHLDFILIGAPTREIILQWMRELEEKASLYASVVAMGESQQWREILFRKLRLFHHYSLPRERLPIVVLGSYNELSKSFVADLIEDAGGLPEESLFIADEVHATGSGIYRRILREDFPYRLGLSATPLRPYDEEGTETVLDYFRGIVYEFSLENAIASGILCQYDYAVYVTTLTPEEHAKFQQISAKLGRLLHKSREDNLIQVKQLAIQRARLIKSASAKLDILSRIVQDYPLQQAMIYCADIHQATQVSQRLTQQGYRVARYSSVDHNRPQILRQLAQGNLDALVAVKCLDEGVDIPSVSQGIILASDTSHRQFIQRRGRILRAAPNKEIATLIDVIVVPAGEQGQLIRSEIERVIYFARGARNQSEVIVRLVEELGHYGISYSDLL
jgi:superfamily II DNA or RNA helicase